MKPAMTPGEILLEDYLIPMDISQNALARALGISPRSINEIVLGRRCITPRMSLKLGKFFKQSAQFWFNIQITCDLRGTLRADDPVGSSPQPWLLFLPALPEEGGREESLSLS